MALHMKELEIEHKTSLRLLGWVQEQLDDVRVLDSSKEAKNGKQLLGNWKPEETECGELEATGNQSIVLGHWQHDQVDHNIGRSFLGSSSWREQASENYYKFAIIMHITGRWDALSNCFFVPSYSPECLSQTPPENLRFWPFRPMNFDNDRLDRDHKRWARPCLVPTPIQESVLRVGKTLTSIVLRLVGEGPDRRLLGLPDIERLKEMLAQSQAVLNRLQRQFRRCAVESTT